jgi:hypothetical protein
MQSELPSQGSIRAQIYRRLYGEGDGVPGFHEKLRRVPGDGKT